MLGWFQLLPLLGLMGGLCDQYSIEYAISSWSVYAIFSEKNHPHAVFSVFRWSGNCLVCSLLHSTGQILSTILLIYLASSWVWALSADKFLGLFTPSPFIVSPKVKVFLLQMLLKTSKPLAPPARPPGRPIINFHKCLSV